MKFGIYLSVFSIVAAVAYGVAFSYTYPLVQITEGLIVLSTVLGLATCLVVVATWKFIEKVTVSPSKLLQGDVPQDQGVSQTQLAGNERELPPLKWSSLKYDFVGGLFDGEEAYG